jgi:O-antigen ligase
MRTSGHTASAFAAPYSGLRPFDSVGVRSLVRRTATPRALVLFMAGFLVVNFARTHELFSFLIPLRLGKLTGYPMLLLLFAMPRGHLRAAFRNGPGRAMLFLGAWMVVGVPFAIYRANSFGYVRGTALISAVMVTAVAAGLADVKARLVVLRVLVVATAVNAASMLLPGASTQVDASGAARAQFGYTYDPNDTAALFTVMIPLALYLGARGGRGRAFWFASVLPMIAALVRTGSRGGLIGMVVMLAAVVVLSPPRRRARFALAGVAGALLLGVLVARNSSLRTRVATVFSSEGNGGGDDYNYTDANGRIAIWKRGVYYMVTHPVTGVGVANFGTAELMIGSEIKARQGIRDRHELTAHNSFVLVGAELGVPGLIAYLVVLGSSVVGLWRLRRDAGRVGHGDAEVSGNRDQVALASALLATLLGGTAASIFLSLAYSPMLLFVHSLTIAVLADARLAALVGDRSGRLTSGAARAVAPAGVVARRQGMRGGAASVLIPAPRP